MKKRQHSPTSKEAHESVKPFKNIMWEKIIAGLEKLKVGGHFEDISAAAGLEPQQTWKRLSELESQGRIYKTGIVRTTSSGRKACVWQLTGSLPKTDKERTIQKQLSLSL